MKNRHRVSQVVSKLTRAAGARCEADEVLGPMILPSCGGLKPMTDGRSLRRSVKRNDSTRRLSLPIKRGCRCVSVPAGAGHYRAVSALGCESSALVTDEPGT
jgi:hypothetical protein